MTLSTEPSLPKIVPVPNGPLYLINDSTPKVVANIEDADGQPVKAVIKVALCRCGGSKNKPLCDGTHVALKFSSKNDAPDPDGTNEPTTPPDKRKNYAGKSGITVYDNRRICSHSAECIHNLESVFRLGERPWINPDGDEMPTIIETIRKCPSGALSYSIDGVEYRDDKTRKPKVIVSKNGPYLVTGGIELAGVENWAEGASKEHYTLCRCGASKNKPFCDGTHLGIKFRE
jgi:CDGSH-type Zn-finger protein